MTPQEHIDAIGEALKKTEEAHEKLGLLINRLHRKLNRAQKAYALEHGNDDNVIQLFSTTEDDGEPGGTDKPDDGDPDEPVEP